LDFNHICTARLHGSFAQAWPFHYVQSLYQLSPFLLSQVWPGLHLMLWEHLPITTNLGYDTSFLFLIITENTVILEQQWLNKIVDFITLL
jgi:hypothetical protein